MEPLRLGFIGAGEMALWSIYPSLHFAPIKLIAVCDLEEGRAREAAWKFGADSWYADYREMWAKEKLDALVVQMHPKLRQSIVLEALGKGYDVFVPKPPAPSYEACVELAKSARTCNRKLMVNFQRRFSFGVRKAREIIAEPEFGSITQLSCSFCSGKYDQRRGADYRGHRHAYLLDFAPHHLDIARYIVGEISRLAVFHNEHDGAIGLSLAVEYESGAVGTFQFSSQRIWWRNYDRVEITGQGAYVVLDGLWSVKHYGQAVNTFTENYSDQRSGELTGDAFALQEFVNAIRADREPVASIHDCVGTMRLYQAIYDAVRQGRNGVIHLG